MCRKLYSLSVSPSYLPFVCVSPPPLSLSPPISLSDVHGAVAVDWPCHEWLSFYNFSLVDQPLFKYPQTSNFSSDIISGQYILRSVLIASDGQLPFHDQWVVWFSVCFNSLWWAAALLWSVGSKFYFLFRYLLTSDYPSDVNLFSLIFCLWFTGIKCQATKQTLSGARYLKLHDDGSHCIGLHFKFNTMF